MALEYFMVDGVVWNDTLLISEWNDSLLLHSYATFTATSPALLLYTSIDEHQDVCHMAKNTPAARIREWLYPAARFLEVGRQAYPWLP